MPNLRGGVSAVKRTKVASAEVAVDLSAARGLGVESGRQASGETGTARVGGVLASDGDGER